MRRGALHLLRLWRGGQLRFRLETFGLYYPQVPGSRRWWQIVPRQVVLLAETSPRYLAWLNDMSRVSAHGAHEWWGGRVPGIDLEGAVRILYAEPGPAVDNADMKKAKPA